MANSTTGDGSYSPDLIAGYGDTGTVFIDTGPLLVTRVISGQYDNGGDGDGTITITGDGADVSVIDPQTYAASRIIVGDAFDSYIGTGRLYIYDGASLISTNNAGVDGGGMVQGGYDNLLIGTGGEFADGLIVVSGVNGDPSTLALNGNSAGFIMGSEGGYGRMNILAGGYFRTLTGVIGAGSTGVTPGGGATVYVGGAGSEFKATTAYGEFLLDTDQAPVIYVGRNDGLGTISTTSGGQVTIQNEDGDGKTSPTLIFGADLNSTGVGQFLSASGASITQYGSAAGGGATVVVGDAGVGAVDVDSNSYLNILGDGANLIVSRGSYDGQGAPVAPLGQSQLTAYYASTVLIDSYGYEGAQATIGKYRLSDGRILISQGAYLRIETDTDAVSDYTSGLLVVGDVGNGVLSVGRAGEVRVSELVVGQRGYVADPLDNSTTNFVYGYDPAVSGGGTGLVEITSTDGKIVVTGTDNSPRRGIVLGEAYGTTAALNVDGAGSYVKSTGGYGVIIIGRYGDASASVTGGAAIYGNAITVGYDITPAIPDTLLISGAGSKVVADGSYGRFLDEYDQELGRGPYIVVGNLYRGVGNIDVTLGAELRLENDAGVDMGPQLIFGDAYGSQGSLEISGATSTVNVIQQGARFQTANGYAFGGAQLIVGNGGLGLFDATADAQVSVTGDGATLVVGAGAYDGGGDPIFSMVSSVLTINTGADVLIDSETYGNDPAAPYSSGSVAIVGDGIGAIGQIDVDGAGSSLTVTSQSDFAGDGGTGRLIIGNLGQGGLNVGNGATVDVRTLFVGANSFYDDGMGGGRQYGGYLPNVTAFGYGSVNITSGAQVTATAPLNTETPGIQIATPSGTAGSVLVRGAGSTLTSQGADGRISIGRYGDGALTVDQGGLVQGFFLEIGRSQGSDGDIYVDGFGTQIVVSNEFGDFSSYPGGAGAAGFVRIGRVDGSNGDVDITDGGRIDVINQAGTNYDNPFVQIARDNGSYGRIDIDGSYYTNGTDYASTLRIEQTGPSGDFVSTGGIGPYGAGIHVGEGGQGVVRVINGGALEIYGFAAGMTIADGRRDAMGNPDTTIAQSSVTVSAGSTILIDSLGYGGDVTFTDPTGNDVIASSGAYIVVGDDVGANGLLTVTGAGSTVTVQSSSQVAGDYQTGNVVLGYQGGSGGLVVNYGGALYARELQAGLGAGSDGDILIETAGTAAIYGYDSTPYQGVRIGEDGGTGSLTVQGESSLFSTGGAGTFLVGNDGGSGTVNLNGASYVGAFFVEVGGNAGSLGQVTLNGYGATLRSTDSNGAFDPAASGPRGGYVRVGRDGGTGVISVLAGASLIVQNEYDLPIASQADGATVIIGDGAGADGSITVSGDNGQGVSSYLVVANLGRSNDNLLPGEYYGPEVRLGVSNGYGVLTVEQNAVAYVSGERAQLVIGEGLENGDFTTTPTSSVYVNSGGQLYVNSISNPDLSLPYNAGADIVIGEETGGNGYLQVSGTGSVVSVTSDNAGDYYAGGGITTGAGVEVGVLGRGDVNVSDGGVIVIDGADDLFPHLSIGIGRSGDTINARGYATVDGIGSQIQIYGGNYGYTDYYSYGAGGSIDVGSYDGSFGRLTISNGGRVSNSVINSKTQIAKNTGATGEIIVTGYASTLNAGYYLVVGGGFDVASGVFNDTQSGDGLLTILDQGQVTAGATYVGSSGTINIDNATLASNVAVLGDFQIAGDNFGSATVNGGITVTSGVLEFDVASTGAMTNADSLTATSAAFLGEAITIDVQFAALFNVGDGATLFQTTGAFSLDTTDTINFVGANPNAGQEFVVNVLQLPVLQQTITSLNFAVVQASLATVAGDLEIVVEPGGQVALTINDLVVSETGVDPSLQTLTAVEIGGGQLESALNPGVAITTFSQQDVNDRLIRFVSDGSAGGAFSIEFDDTTGFTDSVSLTVTEGSTTPLASLSVGDLDGTNGFTLNGVIAGDSAGIGISNVGDINNDGFDDIFIGASSADPGGVNNAGEGYVVFGDGAPFPASFDLATLDGTNGFTLPGLGPDQIFGTNGTVDAVGDINNDGIDDFVIGIGGVDTGGVFNVGAAYLIYGSSTPFPASFDLNALDGTNGTELPGIDFNSLTGRYVAGLGDVNTDGIDDFAIGALTADGSGGADSGEAYIVFGEAGGLGASLPLSSLDGTNGYRIEGASPDDRAAVVGRAGDVNGDGVNDILVGSSRFDGAAGANAGRVYVIFGTEGAPATVLALSELTPSVGFTIDGLAATDSLGYSVSGGGDVNGDGVDDILVTSRNADPNGAANAGETYVIFGSTSGFGASFDLATLDGTNGFRAPGLAAGDLGGYTSSFAGDVNGDGLEDILIGAGGGDQAAAGAGEVYLIFGSTDSFPAIVDLAALDGGIGALITGADAGDNLGRDVSGAGDFNNDGFGDILLGARLADPGGRTDAGEGYVILGGVSAAVAPPLIAGDLVLEVNQGQFAVLTTADVSASDESSAAGDLLYHVTNLVGGIIVSTNSPGVPISTFTQADLQAGLIALQHDNATLNGAGFDLTVTDGVGDIAGPVSLLVDVIPPNTKPEIEIARPNLAEFDADTTNFFFDPILADPGNLLDDFSISFFAEIDASNTLADYFISYSNNDFDQALGVFAVNDDLNVTYNNVDLGAISLAGLSDGGLHHVSLVYTSSFETFDLYFDGAIAGSIGAMGQGQLRTGGAFVVGEGFDDGAGRDAAEGLIGAIGSIRLRNVAQTAQNVALESQGVLSGPNPGLLRDLQVQLDPATGEVNLRNVSGNIGPPGNLQKSGFNDIREPIETDEDTPTLVPTIIIRDLDNSDGQQEVSLSVTNGVINLQDATGLTIIAGANGTNTITFQGLSGDVASALQQVQYIPDPDFEGGDILSIQTDDLGNSGFGGPLTDTRNVLIDVAAVNDDPVAQDDAIATDEDTPVNGDLFADNGNGVDFDVDGPFALVEVDGSPTNVGAPITLAGGGLLTVQNNGQFSFDTNGAYDGLPVGAALVETFTYTIQDALGAVSTAIVDLTINGVNDPPVAQNDAFATDEDTAFAGDLFFDNEFGFDDDVDDIGFFLTAINGDPANVGAPIILPDFGGTLFAGFDGFFDYTPSGGADVLAEGQQVVETFSYEIRDDSGAVDTANVAITLNGLNDAPVAFDDVFLINEDDNRAGNLFANNGIAADFDIDNGDAFTVTAVNGQAINVGQPFSLAGGGIVTVSAAGGFTFNNNNSYQTLSDGDTLTESFTYTISDGLGATSTATVDLAIQGENDPPLAQNDDFQTDEETLITGDLFIDNGFGPDADIDSAGFSLTGVNGNAADVGATIVLPQLGGFLTVQSDGTFEYAPGAGADALAEGEQGVETFAYQITDADGGVDTALARITIDGLNDAPVAQNDFFGIQQNDDLSGDVFAGNGFGPDFDIDASDAFTVTTVNGDPLQVGQPVVVQGGGLVTLNANGQFTFDNGGAYAFVREGQSLPVSFSYEISDSQGAVSGADVIIAIQGVNDAPVAVDDSADFAEDDIGGVFNLFEDNGAGPDVEPEGDVLRVAAVDGQPNTGGAFEIVTALGLRVRVNTNGDTIIDDPNNAFDFLDDGETATDSFTYTASDPQGLTSQAQFVATIIGSNDAPVANNDQFTVFADETLIFDPVAGGAPAGLDRDAEGGALSVVTLDGREFSPGDVVKLDSGASIAISPDGELEYRPSGAFDGLGPNETAEEIFAYEIEDPGGLRAGAQVRIIVQAPDVPPIANDDAVTAAEDGRSTFDLFADNGGGADQNFSDNGIRLTGVNGAPVPSPSTVTLQSGAVIGVNNSGVVFYDPGDIFAALKDGETATDSFSYTITDGVGLQDQADVTVTIAGANDAPVALNDFFRTAERTPVIASLFADNGAGPDTDVDSGFTITALNGDAALVGTETALPSGALLTVEANGAVTFDPNGAFLTLNDGQQGLVEATYTITDDQGAEDTATVIFAIDGITDTIFGTPGDDTIRGTENSDAIDGLGGNDLITGLEGDDSIKGGDGVDIIRGGPDNDLLQGGAGRDRMFGEAGDDRLEGGGGADRLLGLSGDDTVIGGAGNDILSGGGGDDLVVGARGDDRLRGGRDDDTLIGGEGRDRLQGGTGSDLLLGQAGNDNLTGAGGADILSGGGGIDRLFGRRGNDELTGGAGNDRFIFNLGDGIDTITDFDQGADLIRIASGADTFGDLAITQQGDDALIAFGNVRILALDENANDFTSDDFIL